MCDPVCPLTSLGGLERPRVEEETFHPSNNTEGSQPTLTLLPTPRPYLVHEPTTVGGTLPPWTGPVRVDQSVPVRFGEVLRRSHPGHGRRQASTGPVRPEVGRHTGPLVAGGDVVVVPVPSGAVGRGFKGRGPRSSPGSSPSGLVW